MPWHYSMDVIVSSEVGVPPEIHQPNYDVDTYNGNPWVGRNTTGDNFWIIFNPDYDEAVGITISGLRIVDNSESYAALTDVWIKGDGLSFVPQSEYLSKDMPEGPGGDFTIKGPGVPFKGDGPVSVGVEVAYFINGGHGMTLILTACPNLIPLYPIRWILKLGTDMHMSIIRLSTPLIQQGIMGLQYIFG